MTHLFLYSLVALLVAAPLCRAENFDQHVQALAQGGSAVAIEVDQQEAADTQTATAPPKASTEIKEASDFIQDLSTLAIQKLTSPSLTDGERQKKFAGIFQEKFDTDSISRFALGRHVKRAKPDQMAAYQDLFIRHMTQIYASKFKNYHDEQFNVVRAIPNKQGGYWVVSQIISSKKNAPPTSIKWLVIKQPQGKFKVYEVVVEGISMGVTQRSEYASIMNNGSGGIDDLIQALRKKVGD